MYSLKVNLHGSFLEPLTALGRAVGPVTRAGLVLVRGSSWSWPGVESRRQDRENPSPSLTLSFPSSPPPLLSQGGPMS